MTDRFEAILDESISALQAGVPLEEILAEIPEYASEIRPLLYAATLLTNPSPEFAPEEKKAALHAQYMAQVAGLPPAPPTFSDKTQAIYRIFKKRLTKKAVLNDLVTITITVILTLTMVAFVFNYAASNTIPGDFLYGVKRVSENIQYSLAFSEKSKATLEETFNQHRVWETEQLLQKNRAAIVEFKGTLKTKTENLWIIAGFTVQVSNDTLIEGNPQEGDTVEVIGLLRTNNILVADTISQAN